MSFCSDSSFLHENGFRFFKARDYLAVTHNLPCRVYTMSVSFQNDLKAVVCFQRKYFINRYLCAAENRSCFYCINFYRFVAQSFRRYIVLFQCALACHSCYYNTIFVYLCVRIFIHVVNYIGSAGYIIDSFFSLLYPRFIAFIGIRRPHRVVIEYIF